MAEQVTYEQGSEEHYRFLVEELNVNPGVARLIVDVEAGRGGDRVAVSKGKKKASEGPGDG